MRSNLVLAFSFMVTLSACESAGKRTAVGAGVGAAVGAGVGAIIGHQTGNRGAGLAAGALLGGAIGGAVGHRMDKQAKELEKIAETKRTEQGLITKLKSDILFETGKAELKPQATNNLGQMANIMKKYPENVLTIRGYTDATGSPQINKSLSERRAGAVRDELVKGGIPANVITVVGMGPENPVGDNKTNEGRAQNRRVEVEIRADETKVPKT